MKARNWIFRGFAILVILAVLILVVQAEGQKGEEKTDAGKKDEGKKDAEKKDEGKGGEKGKGKGLKKKRGRSRSYDNILCDPVKLKAEIDGGGGTGKDKDNDKDKDKDKDNGKDKGKGKSKGKGKAFGRQKGSKIDILKRVLTEWDKMTAEDKKKIADAITAKNIKDIPVATLVKVPVLCLDRLTLTGITVDQVVEIAKTETSLFTAKDGAKLVADKAALLTKALAVQTLAREYKRVLAEALGSVELKKKISDLDCVYLTGALLDEKILKADITAFDAKFSEKKCKWVFKRTIEKTTEIRIKQAALTKDNIDDCATFLAPVLNKLKLGKCKKLFDKEKLKAATATFLDKIKGVEFGEKSRCAAHIMKYIATCAWLDETKFKTLGSLLRYYPVSELKTKDCQKYPIYEGLPYGNAFKMASFQCAAKDPIAKIVWTDLADTVKLKSEVKGYILTVKVSELAKVPQAKQASTICHADVVKLYQDLLPYGGYGQRRLLAKACKLGSYADVSTFTVADCKDPKKIKELAEIYKRSSFKVWTAAKAAKLDADPDCVVAFLKNKALVSLVRKKDLNKAVVDKLIPEADTITISKLKAKWIFGAITKTSAIDKWTGDDLGYAIFDDVTKMEMYSKHQKWEDFAAGTIFLAASNLDIRHEKYAPLVAAALSTEDYGKLKVSDVTKWSKLCSSRVAALLPESTRKLIGDQLLDSLRVENATHPISALSDDDVDAYTGCLGDLPQDNIGSASKDVQKAFCDVNGAALAKSCLFGNVAKRASTVKMCTTAIKGDAAWTADGIASMGEYACDLPKADIEAMDDAEFTTAVPSFGNCRFMQKDTRDAILTKAKGANVFGTPDTWTSQTLSSLGLNFVYLPKADLDKIKDWLTISDGIRAISKGSTRYFKLLKSCLQTLKGTTAVDDLKKAMKVVWSVIMEKIRAPPAVPKRRRKREVKTFTCQELDMLPADSLTGLTVEEIKAIPTDELKTCYSKLGVPVWDKTKCDALYTRIKTEVAGDNMCTASEQILQDTKNILLCMPDSDINCQPFDTDAKTKAFGDLSGWTSAQLTTLGTRYKAAKAAAYKPADFTDTTIKALGRILCGLPADDLKIINPANFKTALPEQNTAKIYDTCPKDPVLANLLTVCKQAAAYGPIKDWTSTVISEVGILLSAATPEDVKALGANIKEVDQAALQNMDNATLQAIAPENAANLPSTLQNSLGVGPEGTATNSNKPSGAGYVKVEHCLLAGAMTIVIWAIGRY